MQNAILFLLFLIIAVIIAVAIWAWGQVPDVGKWVTENVINPLKESSVVLLDSLKGLLTGNSDDTSSVWEVDKGDKKPEPPKVPGFPTTGDFFGKFLTGKGSTRCIGIRAVLKRDNPTLTDKEIERLVTLQGC